MPTEYCVADVSGSQCGSSPNALFGYCFCVRTTEGANACVENNYCDVAPACQSTAQCASGYYCTDFAFGGPCAGSCGRAGCYKAC